MRKWLSIALLLLIAGCVRPLPGPAPIPAPPVPIVDPSVIAPDGFRALIIYETEAANTRGQLAVIYSPVITDYLNQHCAKSADGKPEWRRWDKDTVPTDTESRDIRDLWQAVKSDIDRTPQLVVANGGRARVYPLDTATEPEAMAVLKSAVEGK